MKKQKQKNHPRQTSGGKKNSLSNIISIKRERNKNKKDKNLETLITEIERKLDSPATMDIQLLCRKILNSPVPIQIKNKCLLFIKDIKD